jgi:hypothetical protein
VVCDRVMIVEVVEVVRAHPKSPTSEKVWKAHTLERTTAEVVWGVRTQKHKTAEVI